MDSNSADNSLEVQNFEEANRWLKAELVIDSDHEANDFKNLTNDYDSDGSNSSISDLENEIDLNFSSSLLLKGKNGNMWLTQPQCQSKEASRSEISSGPTIIPSTILESWQQIFTENMIQKIVLYSNMEIHRHFANRMAQLRCGGDTNNDEILALFGLLYLSASNKDSGVSTIDMWSKFCSPVYKCIMSESRFRFLMSILRFDIKQIRNADDKFGHIQEIWDMFLENCRKSYAPNFDCIIDELLLSFRGKCPFRVFMSGKQDRYGMKITALRDSNTFYLIDAIPYIGYEQATSKDATDSLAKELTRTIHGSGRSVTMDKPFTSIYLADEMLENYNLHIVGALKTNNRDIPTSFFTKKRKRSETSQFAFNGKKMLVCFSPTNKSKPLIVLSTLHSAETIDPNGKPQLINHFNRYKTALDSFDQLARTYTVSRKTLYWPTRFFFGILDQAGINAMVLYSASADTRNLSFRQFLQQLGLDMARPHMQSRLNKCIQKDLAASIKDMLDIPNVRDEAGSCPKKISKQGRCSYCPRKMDRKTKICCQMCFRLICNSHRVEVCHECVKKNTRDD